MKRIGMATKLKKKGAELATAPSYGIVEEVDMAVAFPYVWAKSEGNGATISHENGFSDVLFTAKWRLFEKDGIGLALKPGITLPTGNHKRELGSGRATYSVTFIATKELEPFTFHINGGYTRNENKLEEKKDLWAASFAPEVKLGKDTRIVGEARMSKNTDYSCGTDHAFTSVGINYALTEKIDINLGYKAGLNEAEPDHTLLAGITVRL